MGKSLRVPVLCPYRVPGLETRILGPCWLSAWGRNRQERQEWAGTGRNGQLQGYRHRGCWRKIHRGEDASLQGQLGGTEVPGKVPVAGGTPCPGLGLGDRLQKPKGCSPRLVPLCLGSFEDTGSAC